MNQDKLNDIIKQKADAHTASVPPDAWDNISKKKKRRLIPIFWWSLSSLLIIAGLFLYLNKNKKPAMDIAVNNKQIQTNTIQATKATSNPDKAFHQTNINAKEDGSVNNRDTINSISSTNNNLNKAFNQTGDNVALNEPVKNTTDATHRKSMIKNVTGEVVNEATTNSDIVADEITKQTKNKFATKGRMRSKITAGIASTEDAFTASKNVTTNKKIKFKTTSGKASSAPEQTYVADNTILSPNSPNSIDNSDNSNTTLAKEETITKADNKLISDKQTKPPIDSLASIPKKAIALNQKKDSTQKNINAGKQLKSPSWMLDFGIIPFSPIQQYDVPQYIKRSTVDNNGNTVYTTSAVKSSLQFSAAFAFGVRKSIGKRLMIGTGLQYAQINENMTLTGTDSNTTYTPIQRLQMGSSGPYLVNDTISSTTTGVRIITAVNSYKLYSIPVFIQYSLLSHPSFSIAVTGGSYFTFAQYNNSIPGKLESVYAYNLQPLNEKNELAIDVFGGVRFTKTLYRNFLLFAEPGYRYNVSGYKLKNTFLNKSINQAGITFGLSYKLK